MINEQDMAEEFGRQSEEQNCFEEAQQSRAELDQTALADRMTRTGYFTVVCATYTYYCKATDALVGDYLRIVEACSSRERAEKVAATHPANPQEEDSGWFIYEVPAPFPVQHDSVENDDCPF